MNNNVRRRKPFGYIAETDSGNNYLEDDKTSKSKLLGLTFWIGLLSLQLLFLFFNHSMSKHLPDVSADPDDPSASSSIPRFSERRARKHLVAMTSFGSRVVGSVANEKLVVDYLLEEISSIEEGMIGHYIQTDKRRLSGSFDINFIGGFTSVYDNMNIIAVRFSSKQLDANSTQNALLINCHYDSVTISPGASDDAVSCSIMLEVLRAISVSKTSYLHDIIFLFNGAEENILQASHGFILQHEWAKDIKAFINLEAAGAGGRELLFQSGSAWLLRKYAENVPHPFASIVGQEVFQSGIIPADTDFRIFRDFGNIPGLDMAYIRNGYVYHTEHDHPNMIPTGCIQRGGENLMSLVQSIANANDLGTVSLNTSDSKLIYFDLFGLFMIYYELNTATIINSVAILLALFKIAFSYRRIGASYPKLLLACVAATLSSWLLAVAACVAIALLLDTLGYSMSWYTNVYLLVGIYALPALLVSMVTLMLFRPFIFKAKKGATSYMEQVCLHDATLLLYTIMLVTMATAQIGSAVTILPLVLIPAVVANVTHYYRPGVWMVIIRLLTMIPANIIICPLIYEGLLVFIPVMGRIGPDVIPDLVISIIVAFDSIFIFSYWIPLVFVTRHPKQLLTTLCGISGIFLFLAVCTSWGFPYGDNPSQPTKQKSVVNHIQRTFHDINGSVLKTDSGLLYIPLDRNSLLPVKHLQIRSNDITFISGSNEANCENRPYCGWPYYFPVIADISQLLYIREKAPRRKPETILKLIKRNSFDQIHNFSFSIQGPPHISLFLAPRAGVKLFSWSVGSGIPVPTKMPAYVQLPHYFIYYSYGTLPRQPYVLDISLLAENSVKTAEGLLDIAISGHYFREHFRNDHGDSETDVADGNQQPLGNYGDNHGNKQPIGNYGDNHGNKRNRTEVKGSISEVFSEPLEKFVKSLPSWSAPLYWLATYDAFVF